MAKKVTKRKNIRMRRQIRKTVGCLLLASAIVVAAVPVPEMSARSDQDIERVAVVNYYDTKDKDGNLSKDITDKVDSATGYEKIPVKSYGSINTTGSNATLMRAPLAWRSDVPYVNSSEKIYTTADKSLQFAYIYDGREWIAIILGHNINSLPGNTFTIPAEVDGYRTYDVNVTNGGLCAVGRNGEFLYYRVPAEYRYVLDGVSHLVLDTDASLEMGSDNKVYCRATNADGKEELCLAQLATPQKFNPCYEKDYESWRRIPDTELYYLPKGASTATTQSASLFSWFGDSAAEEGTPIPTETPIEWETATPTETPAEEETPTPTETPAEEETATPTEIPVEEETPTPAEIPVEEETPTPTEIPEEETPTPTETPMGEGTPTPTGTPVKDETPTEIPEGEASKDKTDKAEGNVPSSLPESDDGKESEQQTTTAPKGNTSFLPLYTSEPEAEPETGKNQDLHYEVETVVVSSSDRVVMASNKGSHYATGSILHNSGRMITIDPTPYKQVKDAGADSDGYMRLHNAVVKYIGRQYLSANVTEGTWKIAGPVTSKNPDRGVFAGLGNLVNLETKAGENGESTLVGIGDYAFYGCTSLDSVNFANGLRTLGNGAFEGCKNMVSFNIPVASNIRILGKDTFSGCEALKSITIPTNVEAIGDYCFQGCINLETINMGRDESGDGSGDEGGDGSESNDRNVSLKVIGYKAFQNCEKLSSITFPRGFEQRYPADADVQAECGSDWKDIKEAENGKIPITWFEGCRSLQFIKIQNNTLDIVDEKEMVANYTEQDKTHFGDKDDDINKFLENVPALFYFEGPGINANIRETAKLHSAAFKYMDEDKYEKVMWCEAHAEDPNGSHEAVFAVNSNNQLVEMILDPACGIVDIPGQIGARYIDTIGEHSFDKSKCFLKRVTIPSTVKEIEKNVFKGCHKLEDVIFTQDGTNGPLIGDDAFFTQQVDGMHSSACDKKSTDILTFTGTISPSSTPFLYAMDPENNYNSSAQPESYITFYSGWPSNLIVQYNAKTDKNELIKYPTIADLKKYTVKKYDGVATDPDQVLCYPYLTKENADDANKGAASYPDGSMTGGQQVAVQGALDINLPAGIESIKPGLFSGTYINSEDGSLVKDGAPNTDVQAVTMNTVDTVEPYTFSGCTGLERFYMAGGNKVGDYVFKNCEKLNTVEIGASIAELGIRPFAGCKVLEDVKFVDSPNFVCDGRIIYGLKDGAKKSLIECLETRDERVKAEELAGVESMSEEAFMNCKEVDNVDFSESSIAIIPKRAFANSGVHDVTLSSATTNVLEGAFWNTDALKYLTVNNPITILDNDIFADAKENDGDILYDKDGKPILTDRTGKVTLVVPEGSVAENYANGKPYINLEVNLPIEYWIIPPDGSDKPFKAYDRTTTRSKYEDPVAWEQEKEDKEPSSSRVDKDHPYPGWKFEKWGTYEISGGTGIKKLQSYAEFSQLEGTKFRVTFYDERQPDVTLRSWYVDKNPGESLNFGDVRDPYDMVNFERWESDNGTDLYDPVNANVTFYAKYKSNGSGTVPTPSGSPNGSGGNGNGSNGNNPNSTPGSSPSGSPTATPSSSPTASPSGSPTATPTATPDGDGIVRYTVSVSGGSGSGQYAAGTVVAINAYYRGEGQEFDRWTSSTAGVGFANPESPSTTFTMPAANVAITATYKAGGAGTATTNTGSGASGGGGSAAGTATNNGTRVDVTRPGISNTNLAGASVSGATDNFVVKVTEDQAATDAATAALQARFGDLSRIKYFPMDISLYDSTGRTKIADTSGISVNLTLPLPDELVQYAGNNKIAAIAGGALEDLNARFTTIDGVPCINFTATHFSPYVIYVDTANLTEATIDATPKTGDPIHPKWFLALGMACLSLILFFKRDRVVINSKTA